MPDSFRGYILARICPDRVERFVAASQDGVDYPGIFPETRDLRTAKVFRDLHHERRWVGSLNAPQRGVYSARTYERIDVEITLLQTAETTRA